MQSRRNIADTEKHILTKFAALFLTLSQSHARGITLAQVCFHFENNSSSFNMLLVKAGEYPCFF